MRIFVNAASCFGSDGEKQLKKLYGLEYGVQKKRVGSQYGVVEVNNLDEFLQLSDKWGRVILEHVVAKNNEDYKVIVMNDTDEVVKDYWTAIIYDYYM